MQPTVCKQSWYGMTLIELLIVIAIIGMLSAIAYPSYQEHTRQSYRQQAIADLIRIQLYLESHYSEGYDASELTNETLCNDFCQSDVARYQIQIETDENQYTITATPQSTYGQNQDRCQGELYSTLSLNETGVRLPDSCW